MMYRWMLALKKPSNKLWVTPAIWAVIAVCFAFFGRLAEMFLPANVLPHIESATLEGLLNVIASSMLSVSTFFALHHGCGVFFRIQRHHTTRNRTGHGR